MPKITILGYGTGFEKHSLVDLLVKRLDLDSENSGKIADSIFSGNVIALEIEDRTLAATLAEELENAGATVDLSDSGEPNQHSREASGGGIT